MLSCDGYTSVYEIVSKGTDFGSRSVTVKQIRTSLETVHRFFALSANGVVTQIPKKVITAPYDEYFLFLDEVTWAISLKHLRDGSENIGEPFSIKMGLFGLFAGIPESPIPELAKQLHQLEEASLIIEDENAAQVIEELSKAVRRANAKPLKQQNLRGDAAAEAFNRFISENPKSTAFERDAFGSTNLSGGREEARKLWKELGPANRSKPGPKPRRG